MILLLSNHFLTHWIVMVPADASTYTSLWQGFGNLIAGSTTPGRVVSLCRWQGWTRAWWPVDWESSISSPVSNKYLLLSIDWKKRSGLRWQSVVVHQTLSVMLLCAAVLRPYSLWCNGTQTNHTTARTYFRSEVQSVSDSDHFITNLKHRWTMIYNDYNLKQSSDVHYTLYSVLNKKLVSLISFPII